MHAAPDLPILGPETLTPAKLVFVGVVIGFVLYHLLNPPQRVRVVRLAVLPGGTGPDLEAH